MPMWFLSGALWPLDKSPEWLIAVMLLNPLTYGVDVMRMLLIGARARYSKRDNKYMVKVRKLKELKVEARRER